MIPFFGSFMFIICDTQRFWRRATSHDGQSTSTTITILGFSIYLFQDRETIRRLLRHPGVSSPMSRYTYAFETMFGMPRKAQAFYQADDSGPFLKPYPGSLVSPPDRINRITHEKWLEAWHGAALTPTMYRFTRALSSRIEALNITTEWTRMDDYFKSLGMVVGASTIEAIYGPLLLKVNPSFVEDLWAFDDMLPWLVRGLPSWIVPGTYKTRKRLHDQIKAWYAIARREFHESSIDSSGDGDPSWGSELVRGLHRVLLHRGSHDDDALAAHDLSQIWALSSNSISSAMLAVFHIAKDPQLVRRVREEIAESFGSNPRWTHDVDMSRLSNLPLLSSIYAETLRLYMDAPVVVTAPVADADLGKWRLPRNGLALVNPTLIHKDPSFWNTKDGLHPITSFWADRFLIDPLDPTSGPTKPKVRNRGAETRNDKESNKPVFSTQGLEGAWMPYGGGPSMCPGRLVAKNVIMFTCALLAMEFDIVLVDDVLRLSSQRFGLGMARATSPIPVRLRKSQR
ncbi:cytochrome P450 [Apiospora rasikravindrae]|uniref:Cytochrome P450 n=1 Tax=Apiospora rasikravindrae TaxID=990691 RepID=A0ABR1TA27_9PEZI